MARQRRGRRLPLAALVISLPFLAACAPEERARDPDEAMPAAANKPRVVLETTHGRIVLELQPERAPQTVENFLLHVRSKFYDGMVVHRVLPHRVVQVGELTSDDRVRTSPVFPIPNENPTGLSNARGTVAMARTSDPHSATSQFYINVRDNPEFDFTDSTAAGWGYAVFGRVVEGMDAAAAIAAIPTTREGKYANMPADRVVIERAFVETTP